MSGSGQEVSSWFRQTLEVRPLAVTIYSLHPSRGGVGNKSRPGALRFPHDYSVRMLQCLLGQHGGVYPPITTFTPFPR